MVVTQYRLKRTFNPPLTSPFDHCHFLQILCPEFGRCLLIIARKKFRGVRETIEGEVVGFVGVGSVLGSVDYTKRRREKCAQFIFLLTPTRVSEYGR